MNIVLKTSLLLLSLSTITLFSSCSSDTGETKNAGNAANDPDMKEKMNHYVAVINHISKDLNKGLSYYLNYVDQSTGQPLNNGGVYFMPAIQQADARLASLEQAAQKQPQAPIDEYAADYIAKAKKALLLHNELAAYYGTKENLTDNNAKGLEKHAAYVAALTDFKAISEKVATAYDAYYTAGNASYIAELEANGDQVRAAANKLMNEAERVQKAFYAAIPENEAFKINSALESLMVETKALQQLIETYNNVVSSTPKTTMRKQFLGVEGRVSQFGSSANDMMGTIRSMIAKLQNGDTRVEREYKEVANQYDDMIQNFNFCKF